MRPSDPGGGLRIAIAALLSIGGGGASGCGGRALTIAAAGDLHLGGRYPAGAPRLEAALGTAALRMANLEGPIVEGAEALEAGLDPAGWPTGAAVRLAADPARLASIAGALDVAWLANNHARDQGERGVVETRRHLARVHIAAVDEGPPTMLRVAGRQVALLARHFPPAHALSGADVDDLLAAVRRARADGPSRGAVAVIVSLHWGHTGSLLPTLAQRRLGRALVEAGATAVLGHGPHTPQGVERTGGGLIAYSLGNLAFGCRCSRERDALVLRFAVGVDGRVGEASAHPIEAGLSSSPRPAQDPELGELIADLSRALGTRVVAAPGGALRLLEE